jgi:hypothetical protein
MHDDHNVPERLVGVCMFQLAVEPFLGVTSMAEAVQIFLHFSKLQIIGFVLCNFFASKALWGLFRPRPGRDRR